jgi:hypothetical protein
MQKKNAKKKNHKKKTNCVCLLQNFDDEIRVKLLKKKLKDPHTIQSPPYDIYFLAEPLVHLRGTLGFCGTQFGNNCNTA